MKFVPTAILVLFATTFFGVWIFMDRSRRFLLKLGMGFLLFGVALLFQPAVWSLEVSYNTVLSAILFASAALVLSDGLLMRSGKRFPPIQAALWFVGIVGVNSYFLYVNQSLIVRIYVLNLGLGGIFLTLLWHLRSLLHRSTADRALFWIMALFTLHFFVRTGFTVRSITYHTISDWDAWRHSAFWVWVQISGAIIGASVGIGLLAVIAADTMTGLRKERDSDPLTGLLNRRGLEDRIKSLVAKHRGTSMSIVACDIDYFKKINDTYGHATGDAVLVHVGKMIASALGPCDCAARVGGEEFVVLLYGRSVAEAYECTERLRSTIEVMRLEEHSLVRSVTCSFGIAQFQPHEDFWRAVSRADELLYRAKKAGRNRTLAERVEPSNVGEKAARLFG